MIAGSRIRADRLRATESFYGPSRAGRPSDFSQANVVCPFCPGNEHLCGPPLTGDAGPDWCSRVIANLYPAVVEPFGRHEVIVEQRDHNARWTALSEDALERILRVYREREAAGYADGHAFVSIFKNSGRPAGASLRHPHAQVVALRSLPNSIQARIERLTSECDTCATIRNACERVVLRTSDFVAYVPDGSRTAFEVRIAPVEHGPRLSQSRDALSGALAGIVAGVMKRLAGTLGEDVPFNIVVQSAPHDARARTLMHWEIEIVPRRENFGGFELGTGGFLVSRLPEEAAGMLRAAAGSTGA